MPNWSGWLIIASFCSCEKLSCTCAGARWCGEGHGQNMDPGSSMLTRSGIMA